MAKQQKYAKWKAAYINKCLKTGETPTPGPAGGETDESAAGAEGGTGSYTPPQPLYPTGSSAVPGYPPEQTGYPPAQPQTYQV